MKLVLILLCLAGCYLARTQVRHTRVYANVCSYEKISASRIMCIGLINKFRAILLTTHIVQYTCIGCLLGEKCFPFCLLNSNAREKNEKRKKNAHQPSNKKLRISHHLKPSPKVVAIQYIDFFAYFVSPCLPKNIRGRVKFMAFNTRHYVWAREWKMVE